MKKTKDIISVTFTQTHIDEIIIDYVKNMTPIERAVELVDKHKILFKHYDANPRLNEGLYKYFKKCALITVEHCLLTAKYMPETLNYWNKVKQEIENL
jgi:hypothetical protein